MDIVLDYFDEYAGDAIYRKLSQTRPLFDGARQLVLTDMPSSAFAGSTNTSIVADSPPASTVSTLLNSLCASVSRIPYLERDNVIRQSLSLYVLTYIGIFILYFSVATFSYYFIFDHRMEQHPRFLPNQVRKEIMFSLDAFPALDLLTLPWFLGDVRGWSMLYDTIEDGPFGKTGGVVPWLYMAFSVAFFLVFTDYCIYWIHRWLHLPWLYKRLHKPHHKWIIPSPFASHAFHPVDGYAQSIPYHLCVYICPIHKYLFVALFGLVNLWSIFIHDSDMICDSGLEHYVNGPSHHTLHHIYFNCNYGQYWTWADKTYGSFRMPAVKDDPMIEVLAAIERKKLAAPDVLPSAERKKDQ